MKTIKAIIKLFSYDELNKEAKEKAFDEHYIFLCSVEQENRTEEEINNSVEESIRINEYLFFNDGELASYVTYIGKHPKAGITEFTFKGKVYRVQK